MPPEICGTAEIACQSFDFVENDTSETNVRPILAIDTIVGDDPFPCFQDELLVIAPIERRAEVTKEFVTSEAIDWCLIGWG